MIDFATLTLKQVEKIFVETGYEIERDYHTFAHENDLFKYVGVVDGQARYLIGYEDDEDGMFASMMYVGIGPTGKLVADYGGCPEFETDDIDELIKHFKERQVN